MSEASTIPAPPPGIGVLGLLGVAFVVLKLMGVIDWSWWWVTLPFWAWIAVFLVIWAGAFLYAALYALWAAMRE